ncbi:MAG TPA: hypothetical protein VEA38_01640 [Terriglobales bacterium]|nr:hypothetical protein [Terriglobales bacterium]
MKNEVKTIAAASIPEIMRAYGVTDPVARVMWRLAQAAQNAECDADWAAAGAKSVPGAFGGAR